MSNDARTGSDPFLILTLDGHRFSDIGGFYDEVNRIFMAGEDWRLGESLDALDDMLYGGYGVLKGAGPTILLWRGMERSRQALGITATRDWLLGKQRAGFNTRTVTAQLEALDRGEGQTYFDIVIGILAAHPNIRLIAD